MSSEYLISICIPTYNRPVLLAELLNRLLLQIGDENKDLVEIVISNNNKNSIETDAVMKSYIEKYHYIHYYNNPHIIGFHNTIQTIRHARGKYIISLADDDCLSPFGLEYILDIIRQQDFDVLFHKPIFAENLDVSLPKMPNDFRVFSGIRDFLTYLNTTGWGYKDLISFFSFSSAFVIKTSYAHHALANADHSFFENNDFPHEFLVYYNLVQKPIILSLSTLVIGRILNESYPGSKRLIDHFHQVVDYIEEQNDIRKFHPWLNIRRVCVSGRTRTIVLGLIVQRLGLRYKTNKLLKYMYYFYKKFIQ